MSTLTIRFECQWIGREPDFEVASVNYDFPKLIERAELPS